TSTDAVLFAAHESDLQRIDRQPGSIRELPADELDENELDAGGRIPRLEPLIQTLVSVQRKCDRKARLSLGPMIRFCHHSNTADRIRLASFDSTSLRRLRTALPGVRTSTGTTETALFALGRLPGMPDHGSVSLAAEVDALQVPRRYKGIPVVSADFVDRAHRSDLLVHVWTVNDAESMR